MSLNVPFEIGDVVCYEHEEYDIGSVTCPFCRGRGSVNFGMNEYNLRHTKEESGFVLMPMVRKCKNCENGLITYIRGIRIQKEKVVVNGISAFIPGGLSEISVMQKGGRVISVPQHCLKVLEDE